MTPFSLILIVILLFIFIKDRNTIFASLLAFTAFAELFLTTGYFCHIGTYEFKFDEFILLILSFYLVYMFCVKRVEARWVMCMLCFLCMVIINNFLLIAFPYTEPIVIYGGEATWDSYCLSGVDLDAVRFSWQVIMMDLRYILFLFVILVSMSCFNIEDYSIAVRKFIKFGYLMMVIVLFEFALGSIGLGSSFVAFRDWMMGTANSTAGYFLRGGCGTLSGFTLEPGQLARAFWVWLLVYIINVSNPSNLFMLIVMIIMSLSGSLASVLYIVSSIIIYFILHMKLNQVINLMCAGCLTFCILLIFREGIFLNHMQRITAIIAYLLSGGVRFVGSEGIRLISIVSLFRAFTQHPLWGIGIGSAYSYGGFTDLIATLGCIGACLYMYICKIVVNNKTWRIMSVQMVLLISCCFVGGINIFYSMYTFLVLLSMRLYSLHIRTR